MEEVRSFIAIELPEELKTELRQLQSRLKSASGIPTKWVDPSRIHLTLKFLGYVPSEKLDEIKLAMEDAAEGVCPFRLEVRGLGGFPTLNRIQVAWVGLTGEVDKLCELVQRLESNLEALEYPPEPRPFTPHLTLARLGKVLPEDRQRLGEVIARSRFESAFQIKAESISLMKSQLTREGAIYTHMSSVKLGGKRPCQ